MSHVELGEHELDSLRSLTLESVSTRHVRRIGTREVRGDERTVLPQRTTEEEIAFRRWGKIQQINKSINKQIKSVIGLVKGCAIVQSDSSG